MWRCLPKAAGDVSAQYVIAESTPDFLRPLGSDELTCLVRAFLRHTEVTNYAKMRGGQVPIKEHRVYKTPSRRARVMVPVIGLAAMLGANLYGGRSLAESFVRVGFVVVVCLGLAGLSFLVSKRS